MKKVIAFGGSSSKVSINKQLASYAAHKIEDVAVEVLDLNDFELPLYSIDYENENGIPLAAELFLKAIKSSQGIVLSLTEHNGAYSTAFKNIYDWMSRIDSKLWSNIPMLLMATSPGARGGASVLAIALGQFKHMGGFVVSSFSLPTFHIHFSEEGIKDRELSLKLDQALKRFKAEL